MTPSLIVPKKLYAIQRGDKLVRFYVTAIITRKSGPHPRHDHSSKIEGFVPNPDGDHNQTLTVSPDDIKGPYEEYAELKAREAAEKKAREDLLAARGALSTQAAELLSKLTGIPVIDRKDYRNHGIQISHGDNIEIDSTHMQTLLDFLKRVEQDITIGSRTA